MKKITALTLVLAMALALVLTGCNANDPGAGSTGANQPSTPSSSTQQPSGGSSASAADWPKQPVNVMCPASAGGGTDNLLRLMNEYFIKKTGQSFVISNVTGISGYEQTYQASPDGYNFIAGTTTIFTSKLDGTLDYDYEGYDMVSFCTTPYNFNCVAVRADSPYETINDLLDAAKANPSSVTGGITMSGQPYMMTLALQDALGYELYLADVGNAGERNAALLGGQVDWIMNNTSSCDPYVQSGDFRILAVCGDERYPMNPDVPTFKEMGIDFSFPAQPVVWLAPKGTPAEVCEAFNQILKEISEDPAFVSDAETKLNSLVSTVYSVEDSLEMAKEYKDSLAPYVK